MSGTQLMAAHQGGFYFRPGVYYKEVPCRPSWKARTMEACGRQLTLFVVKKTAKGALIKITVK